jgi:hypothetical protein
MSRALQAPTESAPFACDQPGYEDAAGDPGMGERLPPHDDAAEKAVLSAVICDEAAFAKVRDILKPEHFYSESHRRIFEACAELAPSGRLDAVRVSAWLRGRDRLSQTGGMAYLTEVLNAAPVSGNVHAYAEIVVETWRTREIIRVCQHATAEGYAGRSAGDLLARLEASRTRLQQPTDAGIVLLCGSEIAKPLPELDYLVREVGLVAGGGAPHMVAGYGFSGKTLALQALALALAAGRPVWGSYGVGKRRRVLHVDLEQGERLTRGRYQRLALAMGIDLAELGESLEVAVMPAGLTLVPDCEARWLEIMAGRDLVIVDSLRAASVGQD